MGDNYIWSNKKCYCILKSCLKPPLHSTYIHIHNTWHTYPEAISGVCTNKCYNNGFSLKDKNNHDLKYESKYTKYKYTCTSFHWGTCESNSEPDYLVAMEFSLFPKNCQIHWNYDIIVLCTMLLIRNAHTFLQYKTTYW